MKYLSLLIITLVFTGKSIAQTTYESPYVKEGKTIELRVPPVFHKVAGMSTQRNVVYSTDETVDFEMGDFEELSIGLFTISHMPSAGENLESLRNELMKEVDSDNKDLVVLHAPEIVEENGRKTLRAGFKGNIIDEEIDRMYVHVFEFGDYFVMTYYMSTHRLETPMPFADFVKACNSWKEIATTKEDGFGGMSEEEYIGYDEEEFETNYKNDLFETNLDYLDILPDDGEGWDEPIDENSHLLSEYTYKQNNGSIKIFSGGAASDYPSEEEMANSVQLAMDWSRSMNLKFNSQFSNEEHVFRLYSISGGGTMSSVYTTEVNDEIVFFVVDGGPNPVDDFKPAVRDFMLTMWVDYFDEESIEEK